MTRARILSIPLVTLLPLAVTQGAAAQPSFDCDYAQTATEKTICASPALAELESQMAGVYRQLVDAVGETEARRIADIQLERRQACGDDVGCIERQLTTSIGIFRAETSAATPRQPAPQEPMQAEPQPQPETQAPVQAQTPRARPEAPATGSTSLEEGVLTDLRAAIGSAPAAAPATAVEMGTRDARLAGLEAGFARLPDYRQRMVQGRLRDAGLLAGEVDGAWGSGSAEALERFLAAAAERGLHFAVQRPEGADSALRYVQSDLFQQVFVPEAAR